MNLRWDQAVPALRIIPELIQASSWQQRAPGSGDGPHGGRTSLRASYLTEPVATVNGSFLTVNLANLKGWHNFGVQRRTGSDGGNRELSGLQQLRQILQWNVIVAT